mgnify:FL=1
MKKFWTVCFGVFLIFSSEAQAECFTGMVFSKGYNSYACSSCSGSTCTASVQIYSTASACKKHSLTQNACLQCLDSFTLRNGNCKCGTNLSPMTPGEKYIDSTITPVQCRSCSAYFPITGGQCSKCVVRLTGGSWKCYAWTCNSGYYKTDKDNGYCKPCSSISVSNGTCTACASNRRTCTSATCSAGYAWNGSVCARLNCAAGQYVSGNSCAACPSGQWSKGGTATSCSPCSSIGITNGKCTACSASGGCTAVSCNGGYKANGASCVQVTCSAGQYVSGNSCAACPSGQWSKGGTATSCSPCSSLSVANGTCTACTAAGACSEISCNDGYVFKAGACVVKKCVSGTYEDASGSCRPCSDIAVVGGVCTSCSYDGSVCESVSCAEGWTNASVTSCTATKTCSAGGFWDEESQSCKRCDTYMIANGDALNVMRKRVPKPNATSRT